MVPKLIAGRHPLVHKLAQRLAPGRHVKNITINMNANSLITATVTVAMEEEDLKLVAEIVDDVRPDVMIVEVPKEER